MTERAYCLSRITKTFQYRFYTGAIYMRLLHSVVAVAILSLCAAAPVSALSFILNEWNAVSNDKYIDTDDYNSSMKGDTYFATYPGITPDGRIEGNGGNWIEFVVVEDHVDLRNWEIHWSEAFDVDASNNNTAGRRSGTITFADNIAWADLRQGTILTISERALIQVDTDLDGDFNRNFTDSPVGDIDVVIDLTTDLSFDPANNDWWVHVSTKFEHDQTTPLITTVVNNPSNYIGSGTIEEPEIPEAGEFSVTNDGWESVIYDGSGSIHQNAVGERGRPGEPDTVASVIWNGGGINSNELGKLEQDPSSTIGNSSTVNEPNYVDGESSTFGLPNEWDDGGSVQDFTALRAGIELGFAGDFNGDGRVDAADYTVWRDMLGTRGVNLLADGDRNGVVDAGDYGVWRANFGNSLATGSLTTTAAVPEPTAVCVAIVGAFILAGAYRRV